MNGETRRVPRWIIAVLQPPFSFFMSHLYPPLFGWADRSAAWKNQRRLARDIEGALPFLFERYSARIVPNQGVRFPPGFDYAFVTVALDAFLLRFLRGRGELAVSVAPSNAPSDWQDLPLVTAALNTPEDVKRRTLFDLSESAGMLEPQMTRLNEMFSKGEFDAVKQRLQEQVFGPERAAMLRWPGGVRFHDR